MPRMPNPPGTTIASTPASAAAAPGGSLAVVGRYPADVHVRAVREPGCPQRLGHRQVGVRKVDVLADEPDGDLVPRIVDAVEQVAPYRPVDITERQAEPAHDVGIEPFGVEHLRDLVDARRIDRRHHRFGIDVAHQRDLALEAFGQFAIGPAHDRVRADADAAQGSDRVLGRLGLQFAGRREVRDERDVQEEAVVAADIVAHLAGGFEERQRLDVADRPADLGDHDVRHVAVCVGRGHRPDA